MHHATALMRILSKVDSWPNCRVVIMQSEANLLIRSSDLWLDITTTNGHNTYNVVISHANGETGESMRDICVDDELPAQALLWMERCRVAQEADKWPTT